MEKKEPVMENKQPVGSENKRKCTQTKGAEVNQLQCIRYGEEIWWTGSNINKQNVYFL